MDKQYIEREYHLAMLDFRTAEDENGKWSARKNMARLERLAIEFFGEEFQKKLRKTEKLEV